MQAVAVLQATGNEVTMKRQAVFIYRTKRADQTISKGEQKQKL